MTTLSTFERTSEYPFGSSIVKSPDSMSPQAVPLTAVSIATAAQQVSRLTLEPFTEMKGLQSLCARYEVSAPASERWAHGLLSRVRINA